MADKSIQYRSKQVGALTNSKGVYALCDLDEVPIYVGQSIDGIRSRVRRHLTSARSDIIANRMVDVWEVAFVWAWPVSDVAMITTLEAHLFHKFNGQKTLMNGSIPANPRKLKFKLPEKERIQIMTDELIQARLDPVLRLPRQIEHCQRLVDHILTVKDTNQLRNSLQAHFERLSAYNVTFLSGAAVQKPENEDDHSED